jgi:peroxiredoxin
MMNRIFSFLLIGTGLALAQPASAPLKEGASIPDVKLRTESDQEVSLRDLVAEKPTVLIFYRGGWCPFCTRHLSELAGIETGIEKVGAQLLAISMDKPERLRETVGVQLVADFPGD